MAIDVVLCVIGVRHSHAFLGRNCVISSTVTMASTFQRARLLFCKLSLVGVNIAILMFLLNSFDHPPDNRGQIAYLLNPQPNTTTTIMNQDVGLYSIEVVLTTGVILISGIIVVIKEHLVCSIAYTVFSILITLLSITGLRLALILTAVNAAFSIWFTVELYFKQEGVITCREYNQAESFVRRATTIRRRV